MINSEYNTIDCILNKMVKVVFYSMKAKFRNVKYLDNQNTMKAF